MGYDPTIGDLRSERFKLIRDLYDTSFENLIKSESETSASGLKPGQIIIICIVIQMN